MKGKEAILGSSGEEKAFFEKVKSEFRHGKKMRNEAELWQDLREEHFRQREEQVKRFRTVNVLITFEELTERHMTRAEIVSGKQWRQWDIQDPDYEGLFISIKDFGIYSHCDGSPLVLLQNLTDVFKTSLCL